MVAGKSLMQNYWDLFFRSLIKCCSQWACTPWATRTCLWKFRHKMSKITFFLYTIRRAMALKRKRTVCAIWKILITMR